MSNIIFTNQSTPATPSSGRSIFFVNDITKTMESIDDNGVVTSYTSTAQEAVPTYQSTGLITGGVLSIGSPNTTFSISDGTGIVIDNTSIVPTNTSVSWTGKTNIAATFIGTAPTSYVAINNVGAVIQSSVPFTNSQHRDYIVLGSLIHVNLAIIDAINQLSEAVISPANQLSDLESSIGKFNVTGNLFSSNGANLLLNKSIGTVHAEGSNWAVNKKDPNVSTLVALVGLTFQYRFQNGTNGATGTSINPNIYDLAGVSTAVSSNRFTIQRIFSFVSNNVKIMPGQIQYTSMANAKAAIQTEIFTTEQSIVQNGILRGLLVVKQGLTNLQSADAFFYEVGKFGGVTGIGGQSVSTLQNAYDNSVNPEIITSVANGALTVKRGTASDTDKIFEVQNGAGSVTFSVDGNGNIAANNLSTREQSIIDALIFG